MDINILMKGAFMRGLKYFMVIIITICFSITGATAGFGFKKLLCLRENWLVVFLGVLIGGLGTILANYLLFKE
jgi:hypothetical protein